MEKTIYDLLNDAQIDVEQYEEVPMTKEEKEKVHKFINKKTEKNVSKKSSAWKKVGILMAASFALVILVFATNPALAKEGLSRILDHLIGFADEKGEETDAKMFNAIGEKTKETNKEYFVTENGITISISDIICDGNLVYYTTEVKLEESCEAEWLFAKNQAGVIWMDEYSCEANMSWERTQDGTYVWFGVVDVAAIEESSGKEYQDGDVIRGKFVIQQGICGYAKGATNETCYEKEGKWELEFEVPVDKSLNKTIEINQEKSGVELVRVTKTNLQLIFEYTEADPMWEVPTEEGGSWIWVGEKGTEEEMPCLRGECKILPDGRRKHIYSVMYQGEEEVVVKYLRGEGEAEEVVAEFSVNLAE